MTNPTSSTTDFTASAGVNPASPENAPKAVSLQATAAAQPGLTAPAKRGSGLLVAGIIGIIVVSLVSLFVIAYLVTGLGLDAFALGGIMALVPLAIVFFGVRWIDRWEPEPRLAVVFAFLWGAGVSVLLALIVGAEIDNVVASLGGPGPGYEFFGAAIQAPVVEEFGKGLGLLIIFLVARKHFDGPVDGLVYAAWVAGGFAFTENILYFGSQVVTSDGINGDVYFIFIVRGLMSPFAHVMFTAVIGIAIGLAARRGGAGRGILAFAIGLIPAVFLHALWNGALFFVPGLLGFLGYYILIQVPLFIGAIVIAVWLRRQEAKLTYDRLAEYASAGWFAPGEITALATPAGRRQAITWAKSRGTGTQMKAYIANATKLAFARQRIITGRDRIGASADEASLLTAIVDSRRALVSAPPSS